MRGTAVTFAPAIVHHVVQQSRGVPLDPSVQAFMEGAFGYKFGRVRLHTGAPAVESARAVNASAYTVGWSIVFGDGYGGLASDHGWRLLAHELAHVVQQTADDTLPTSGLDVLRITDPSSSFEPLANDAADAVIGGARLLSAKLVGATTREPVVQRDLDRNLAFNTLFSVRLQSVMQERRGGHSTYLHWETGHSLSHWMSFFDDLFPTLTELLTPEQASVARDAAWASAIYEWAARAPQEALTDEFSHRRSGAQLMSDPGPGASIGPFQGYASMVYAALDANTVRFLGTNPFARRDAGMRRILAQTATPGTFGIARLPGTLAQEEISRFSTLSSPVVSLVGKARLSVRCAQRVFGILGDRRLPAPVLRWVLLCYESHGEADRYARAVADRFDRAGWGSEVSLEDMNPSAIEGRLWDRRRSLRLVLAALGIPVQETFRKTLLTQAP